MEDRLVLRPVLEDDLELLQRLTNDPEGTGPHEWHGYGDPHLWRHRWAENGLLGTAGGALMVCRGADALGFVTWRQVSTGQISNCWEIGIGLAPQVRGQGAGTIAQRLLVRYLFAHTQANRIQAVTDVTNTAEQRALEKAGFAREGVLRGFSFRAGRWHDSVLYSVLREEAARPGDTGSAGHSGDAGLAESG